MFVQCARQVPKYHCYAPAETSYYGVSLCRNHALDLMTPATEAQAAAKYLALNVELPGFCYFGRLTDGRVKIGESSSPDLLRQRFGALARKHQQTVTPVLILRGGMITEMVMHRKFRAHRILGETELFMWHGELADYIAEPDLEPVSFEVVHKEMPDGLMTARPQLLSPS